MSRTASGRTRPGHAYSNEQLVEVVTTTGADLLAPQLGTAHGLYKASPVLLYDRVAELGKLSDRSRSCCTAAPA